MEEAHFFESSRHEASHCLIAHKLVFGSYLLTRMNVICVEVGKTLLEESLHLCSECPHQTVYVEYNPLIYPPITLTHTPLTFRQPHCMSCVHQHPDSCLFYIYSQFFYLRFIILSYTIITPYQTHSFLLFPCHECLLSLLSQFCQC